MRKKKTVKISELLPEVLDSISILKENQKQIDHYWSEINNLRTNVSELYLTLNFKP